MTQMRPDKAALGRLKRGLHNPKVLPKRPSKRQRRAAGRSDDDDPYGREGPGPKTTGDPFGDDNADATRLQTEAEVRARELAGRDLELDPGAGPKTKSSTSSSTPASPALPSPAISLVETAPESPVELVTGPGGEALPVRVRYDSSGDESERRERRVRRGERERYERAREEDEWQEDEVEDPTQGKEG